ncbi:MAG: ankyrin repeat domain-containing protein [Ferruginibacter sp.]
MWITAVVTGIALGWVGCRFIRNDELNQAAVAGNSKRTTELLSKGANVNGRGMHAMTPIMSAARGGHLKVVELLVAKGADVNSHNDSGSALMWAVDSGSEELVSYLLRSGVDAQWTNALGSSALDFAREQKKTNIVRLLEARRK